MTAYSESGYMPTSAPMDIAHSQQARELHLDDWEEVLSNTFNPYASGMRDIIGTPDEDEVMLDYEREDRILMEATGQTMSSSPVAGTLEPADVAPEMLLHFNPSLAETRRRSSGDSTPTLAKKTASGGIQKRSSVNKGNASRPRRGTDTQLECLSSMGFDRLLYGACSISPVSPHAMAKLPTQLKGCPLLGLPFEILTMILEDTLLPPWPNNDSRLVAQRIQRKPFSFQREESPELEFELTTETPDIVVASPANKSIHPAKTLIRISRTCSTFRKLIIRDPHLDISLWRAAARSYFQLPEDLHEVQGINHITTWRNVFDVFLAFESPSAKNENVPSFGGKCTPAVGWSKYVQQHGLGAMELAVLCLQPGPDDFEVVYNAESNAHTLFLGLAGGDLLVNIDAYGVFKPVHALPPGLQRSKRGWFPANIFETRDDRFAIQEAVISNDNVNSVAVVPKRWDLKYVNDVRDDELAKVARCARYEDLLVFSLFRSNEDDDFTTAVLGLDPPESNRLYCLRAETSASSLPTDQSFTPFQWTRRFEQPSQKNKKDVVDDDEEDEDGGREVKEVPSYTISSIRCTKSYAAILIRWNLSNEILDTERQFHILSITNGTTVRILTFPAFSWDFRHNDMSEQYNSLRLSKLKALYNGRGAQHRTTRVHDDQFVLTERSDRTARIISGSHDYCNWIWNIDPSPEATDPTEPDTVLDDFYWKADADLARGLGSINENKWSCGKERAGWWVRTPNQVLDFWHGFAVAPDGRYFTACRAGKIFSWDLEDPRSIRGFTSLSKPHKPEGESSTVDGSKHTEDRYLGCLNSDRLIHQFRNWHEWKNQIPEQGLWMGFKDGTVVYLDREDILKACGVEGREWIFQKDDFESISIDVPVNAHGIEFDVDTRNDFEMNVDYNAGIDLNFV